MKGLNIFEQFEKAPEVVYEGGEDFSKGFIELKTGRDLTIFASGIMVAPCLRVARELEATG